MKCQFSETQFSFCFTFEYLQQYSPWSLIPFFPNTYLEGQPGYGYDVSIDGNIFLQYKIPEFITRKNSRNPSQWNSFNSPFYRIKLDTNSEQYRLLKALKTIDNEVCYVTPEFYKSEEIKQNYLSNNIILRSSIFPIDYLPHYLSGYHNLCYQADKNTAFVFSERFEINKKSISEILYQFEEIDKKNSIQSEAKRIKKILENVVEIKLEINETTNLENYIKNLLLAKFNIIWIPILSRNQELNIRIE